MTCS